MVYINMSPGTAVAIMRGCKFFLPVPIVVFAFGFIPALASKDGLPVDALVLGIFFAFFVPMCWIGLFFMVTPADSRGGRRCGVDRAWAMRAVAVAVFVIHVVVSAIMFVEFFTSDCLNDIFSMCIGGKPNFWKMVVIRVLVQMLLIIFEIGLYTYNTRIINIGTPALPRFDIVDDDDADPDNLSMFATDGESDSGLSSRQDSIAV